MVKKYQSILEYVLLIAIAAAAVKTMHTYISRAVHAHLKVIEDQLNNPEIIDEVR